MYLSACESTTESFTKTMGKATGNARHAGDAILAECERLEDARVRKSGRNVPSPVEVLGRDWRSLDSTASGSTTDREYRIKRANKGRVQTSSTSRTVVGNMVCGGAIGGVVHALKIVGGLM